MEKRKFNFALTSFILSICAFIIIIIIIISYQFTGINVFFRIIFTIIYFIGMILAPIFGIISFFKKEEKWYLAVISIIIASILFLNIQWGWHLLDGSSW